MASAAWLLKRSPSMVVIPGTANPAHVREHVAAAEVTLTDQRFHQIARIGQKAAMLRTPKP